MLLNSCFSHAIALAEGNFLTKLSPSIKKKVATPNPTTAETSSNMSAGEVNPEIDEEDTEEEITELVSEIEAGIADLPSDSEEVKLAVKLLLKIQGFIAKVTSFFDFLLGF